MAKEKKYSNSESFEIYCNYGVLGAEKEMFTHMDASIATLYAVMK